MAILVAVSAVGSVGLVAVSTHLYGIERSPVHRLAGIVGDRRVTHARLTGGFAYGPCEPASAPNDSLVVGLLCAASKPASPSDRNKLARLAADLRRRTARGNRATDRHASGAWNVVWRNSSQAIQELQAAAQLEPSNARVQNDLAVALLERAQVQQDPLFILEAYAAVDSALALDAKLPEALFNRAVVLEHLYLDSPARDAWSAYLDVDKGSAWAEEARTHLRTLGVQRAGWEKARNEMQRAVATADDSALRGIAGRFPWRVRNETQKASSEWANAYLSGAKGSDSLLQRVVTLSRALARATSDPLWADIAQSVVDASPDADRARLDAAARGLVSYDRGDHYLLRLDLDSATALLAVAARELKTARNPLVYLVAYDEALISVQRHTPQSYEAALGALRRLSQELPSSYRGLHGLIARTEGLVEGSRGNIDAAITAYGASAESGRQTGDASLELRSYANLTVLFAKARGERAAWEELYNGFRSSSRYADTQIDAQRFFTMAAENSWRRYPRLAALFQSEAVRLAKQTVATPSDSLRVLTALIREAELFVRSGSADRASRAIQAARAYTAGIQRQAVRDLYAANLDIVQGAMWLRVNADSAVRVLRDVVHRYQKTDYLLELDRAYLLLASAYNAVGEMDAAQRDFEAALAETDRRRSTVRDPEQQARFVDQARPLIDRFVTFLADRGDTVGALNFMESMRARVLLETLSRDGHANESAHSVADVRRSLPGRTSLVSYAIVGNEVITWIVNRDTIAMFRTPRAARVEYLVGRFSALIASRSATREIRDVAAELYSLLIAPFARRVEPGSRLVFVPDKSLHFLPFPALFDGESGRFVAQSFEVSVAPSIALYYEAASRYDRLRASSPPSVLAIGNPLFDSRAVALPPLPGAEREASRVAAYYGSRGSVLLAANATRNAFARLGRNANVIHFAGHAVVMPEAPLQSYLVLAQDSASASSGALYARELSGIDLPQTQLVILSGCETASGRVSETEGASSLARAFFAAGVPAVIASLWAVDDEMTADFFARYHAALLRGIDPTAALANTQREWLRDKEGAWQHIADWAAFELFGGTGSTGERSTEATRPST